MAAAGIALCALPGFDAPNYHSAFVLALFGGLVAGPIGIIAGRRALARHANPFRAALRAVALPALTPLALLMVNGLRVRQCDVFGGIAFELVGPIFTMAWAALIGAGLSALHPHKRRTIPLFYLVWLGWVALDLLHLYRHPAIFAYNPFVGFFSGAVYDTVIAIDSRLLLYRLNNVAQALLCVALVRLAYDRARQRTSFAAITRAPPRRAVAAIAAATACILFWVMRAEIGYDIARSDIDARLGALVSGPRLVLHYDRATIPEADARALYEDHLYRLDQIERALETTFPRPIASYVYGSNDQKRLLMGAAQVYIAKPWLAEIHLSRVPYGAPVIGHELAHVVLGHYAPPPLQIPTVACIVPQMTLVEGAAEAFEWDTGALTPHQWTAAMRAAHLAPPIAQLLGPGGFWSQSSDRAYTLAGSFIRWLIDTHGPARFTDLYADADFERAYQTPLASLVAEWEAFVDALEVPPDAADLATGRYSQHAVFFRPCGLDVAKAEAQAQTLAHAGDRAGARSAYEQVVRWIPDDPQKRVPLLEMTAQDGDYPAASRIATEYFAAERGQNIVTNAKVLELLGDAAWRANDPSVAAMYYGAVRLLPQPEDRRRNLLVKAWLTAQGPAWADVGAYLLSGQLPRLDAAALAHATGDLGLVRYLVGRRHATEGRHVEAIPALTQALATLPDPATRPELAWLPWVRREAERLLAHAHFALRHLAEARAYFLAAADHTPYAGDRDRYRDWAARCDWLRDRTAR